MLAGKLETAEAAVHIYSTTAVPKNVKFTGYCKIHMHSKPTDTTLQAKDTL